MAQQDYSTQIAQMMSDISSLKTDMNAAKTKITDLLQSHTKLDNYLDQNSKDIINQIFRKNFMQVKTVVTAGFTLLPQSQYIQVSGSASRTSSTATAISNGTWIGMTIFIEGTDNTNTIVFKDAANTNLAGDCTLGLNDTLTVMWTGKLWVELARSNN